MTHPDNAGAEPQDLDGGISDNPGSFVEIVPQARLVFASLLLPGMP